MPDRPLSPRARVAIVAAASVVAAALTILLLALIPGSRQLPDLGWVFAVVLVAIGVGFFSLGAVVWLRRPDNRTGLLMLIEGLVILVTGLQISSNQWLFIIGSLTDALVISAFIHMLVAFPSGRLESRAARVVVGAAYAAAVLQIPVVLFGSGPDLGCDAKHPCPPNPLLIEPHSALTEVVEGVQAITLVGAALVTVFLLLRRYRASGPLARRGLAPVLFVGAAILLLAIIQAVLRGTALGPAAQGAFFIAFALLPVAFLLGLSRSRPSARRHDRGADRPPRRDPGAAGIDAALGGALGDPTLAVAYWLDDGGGYVDRDGRRGALPPPTAATGAVATEIAHDGRGVGALVHDARAVRGRRSCCGDAAAPRRWRSRTRAWRSSCARGSRRCAPRARGSSRPATPSAAGSAATSTTAPSSGSSSLMIELQLARERFERRPAMARELVDQRVRQRARGRRRAARPRRRHPSRRALPARARRRARVARDARAGAGRARDALGERLPSAVETAAYFVVAEALTNVAKYADATHAPRRRSAARTARAVVEVARRRRRRRGRRRRQRPARPRRPRRRARRHARGREPARRRARWCARGSRRRLSAGLNAQEREHGEHAAVVLGAAGDAELGEDARSRASRPRRGDDEHLGDAPVRAALGHQLEHLALARRERRRAGRRGGGGRACARRPSGSSAEPPAADAAHGVGERRRSRPTRSLSR